MPFSYQNMDFHRHTCFFIFSDLGLEVIVRFVDIDGIGDHYCFHCYYIGIFSFFFRKCTDDLFKTWKHTSFLIFCYCYTWYKVTSLLVFHHNVLSHVSKVNYHVHAVFFKSTKTPDISAPYFYTFLIIRAWRQHFDFYKYKYINYRMLI